METQIGTGEESVILMEKIDLMMKLKGFVNEKEIEKFREEIEIGDEPEESKKKDIEFNMDKFLDEIDPKEAPKVMKAIKVLMDRKGFVSEKELGEVLKDLQENEE